METSIQVFKLILLIILLAGCQQPIEGDLIVKNVSFIDVENGGVITLKDVVITGEKISSIVDHQNNQRYQGEVIDGTGKYLIPGLWDMHAHTSSDRITREILYPLFVAHGITGIRNLKADCFEASASPCLELESDIEQVKERRREVAAGELIGPRVVAGSMMVHGPPPGEPSTVQDPGTEAHARALVRLLNERGVDFIKVYNMVPREAYFALADEANRLGLPFAGHVPLAVRASEASDAGQVSIEHLRNFSIQIECSSSEDDLRQRVIAEYESDPPDFRPLILELVDTHDAEKCVVLAEQFARNGTWVVPTLMTASGQKWDWREAPYARFLPPEERRLFERMEEIEARDVGNAEEQEPVSRWVREVTRTMHRAGVPMLAGSDAGSSGVFWGISLHQELELLVDAGLTEVEALRAATLSPAEFLKRTNSLGTVEPDKLADLVLLDANPLEDISNTQKIHAVMANGRYFDRKALDKLLQEAERTAKEKNQIKNN